MSRCYLDACCAGMQSVRRNVAALFAEAYDSTRVPVVCGTAKPANNHAQTQSLTLFT